MADKTELNQIPDAPQKDFAQIEVVDSQGNARTVDVNDTAVLNSIAKSTEFFDEHGQPQTRPQLLNQPDAQEHSDDPLFAPESKPAPDDPLFAENTPNAQNQPDLSATLNPVLEKIEKLTETIAAGSTKDEFAEEIAMIDKAEQGWTTRLEQAIEGKNAAAQAKAQSKLQEVAIRRLDVENRQKAAKDKTPANEQQGGEVEVTPAAKAFMQKHASWWQKPGYEDRTLEALEYARKLHAAGYDPANPNFYAAVEGHLKQKFKPANQQPTQGGSQTMQNSPTQPTANRNKASGPRLAPAHTRIIQDFGLNLNSAADQKKIAAIAESYDARMKRNHPSGR